MQKKNQAQKRQTAGYHVCNRWFITFYSNREVFKKPEETTHVKGRSHTHTHTHTRLIAGERCKSEKVGKVGKVGNWETGQPERCEREKEIGRYGDMEIWRYGGSHRKSNGRCGRSPAEESDAKIEQTGGWDRGRAG
jgi:hypothetical protein